MSVYILHMRYIYIFDVSHMVYIYGSSSLEHSQAYVLHMAQAHWSILRNHSQA